MLSMHRPLCAQTIDDIPAPLVDITPGASDARNDMKPRDTAGDPTGAPDLGESPDLSPPPVSARAASPSSRKATDETVESPELGTAARAVRAAKRADDSEGKKPLREGTERVVFNRRPVGVALPVGQERLITMPGPSVLHVPTDIEVAVRLESIGRTVYATALRPFETIRIIAELVDTGEQIPLDLVANEGTVTASAEMEVFLSSSVSADRKKEPALSTDDQEQEQQQAADMVELTRHAARALYAPRRLAYKPSNISQVGVDTQPVDGLIAGALVETTPVGQWRSGNLYVTAVVVRNRSKFALEVPLEDVRGQWLSATAQHGRIGPAGSETDTTAIYLVCQRAFESCR
ncbi:TIGR03749 family integrating conjugative element protein [Lampropedia puyangensis]|uniref:TIGR03749 family integrating conjugative element protein n=2 Tax=Lampropedia puyangensis TaxID=1330072 RepID=A0A4S8EVB2_9BURK|nr:TIGR03749 family integrating conjugative element protein [Lampropedia puyangensis]